MLDSVPSRARRARGRLAGVWLVVVVGMAAAACGGLAAAPTVPGGADVNSLAPSASGAPSTSAGASASAGPTASVDPRDAMFAWAKCMREHGVDMPDPKVDGQGGVSITVGGGSAGSAGDPSSTAFQDASKACQSLMPNAGTAPAASPDPAMQDKLLAYAKCMREHGVDMPDPKFGSDGGVSIQVGGAIDPSSDTFSKADKTCGGTGTGGFSVGSSSAPGTQP